MTTNRAHTMSDSELIDATVRAAATERRSTVDLLVLLAELDSRRLYLGQGCSSLFTYCTQVLHMSEHAAYHRIEAARTSRLFPIVLELLADGELTMTTITLLRPHLTLKTHRSLLDAARHKSKRDVEHQVAALAPKPAPSPVLRRLREPSPSLPEPVAASSVSASAADVVVTRPQAPPPIASSRPPVIAPTASGRYLLKVTISAGTHALLRRAQDLLRHTVPKGEPAVILDRALSLLVRELERQKLSDVPRPRTRTARHQSVRSSRRVPASVRREVWRRDQGRCTFVGNLGRCQETGQLEFHHLVPFARGGPSNTDNIALRCRAHNQFEGRRDFGQRRDLFTA